MTMTNRMPYLATEAYPYDEMNGVDWILVDVMRQSQFIGEASALLVGAPIVNQMAVQSRSMYRYSLINR